MRDTRLDSLRGLFLVVMTIDHLGSTLSNYTSEVLGFVSAAAGFVMLSGYMFALTACRKSELSLHTLAKKSLKRVSKLYRYHVALLLLLTLLIAVSPIHRGYLAKEIYVLNGGAWQTILYGATLLHQPTLLFLLPMYMVFSLVSPFVITGFARGWVKLVLGTSVAVWLIGLFFDPMAWLTHVVGTGTGSGAFDFFSWQLLWVTGLYGGFCKSCAKRIDILESDALLCIASGIAFFFLLARHHVLFLPTIVELLLQKNHVAPLRLLNILSLLVIFYRLLQCFSTDRRLPLLSFLGKYSLQVFCFHIFVLCLLQPLSWRVGVRFGPLANVIYSLCVVASLAIPAVLYESYGRYKSEAKAALARTKAMLLTDPMLQNTSDPADSSDMPRLE